jgi:sugar phosphate isomerase/epimerase
MIQPFLRATSTLCISLLILSGCGRDAEPQQDQAPEAQVETAAASTADSDCKLGVQLYSFRHDLDKDLPGTLARVKQLGIDCIEPYSLHGLTPEALRAEFDKAGLRVVSYHLAGELFRGPPEAAVNIARVLGAEQVGVAWIKESENDAVDEAKLMKAADQLNAMCPAAQAAGMKVFYHTHGYEFHEGDPEGKLFDKFVQALTPECVVLQLDVYWVAYAGQDPVKLINRYADRTLSLHIKDMAASQTVAPFDGSKWSGPLTDESFAVIGQGKLDWPALFEAAKAANVRWYIIEDETTKPYDAVTASLPFLKEHGIQ